MDPYHAPYIAVSESCEDQSSCTSCESISEESEEEEKKSEEEEPFSTYGSEDKKYIIIQNPFNIIPNLAERLHLTDQRIKLKPIRRNDQS